ncbi:hypothetical protein G7Z17_g4522 [Cylindrodendrum hubeiense]|uniref:Fumarylacetoacetase-like C-terminal domain-containing protein n=1 Tax=Cylindrodendrum hubeiense TaxID=595255 RepID=A0A9P5HFV7_9HYPO|nr:hypothetical protein G7Z17_g4522 [Cylindrodendrum hubeiense]
MGFRKLVRYEYDGNVHYGDLLETSDNGFKVVKLSGNITDGFSATESEPITVKKLLCPLENTPIVQCVGVNYRQHATEAKMPVPEYPVIFSKPSDTLAGPLDDIPVHPDASPMMDFEGELTVVIGRDAKNVSESEALDYVFGYTAGNDVSARNFQLKDAAGGQFGYSKSFDAFAPIGPAIWSAKEVPNPQTLQLTTRVNGEVRQATNTSDMIWSVQQIIAHLSRGRTLKSGTVIMTGTPSGVGFFQKRFLKDGDIVEVEIEGLGKVSNKMVFV